MWHPEFKCLFLFAVFFLLSRSLCACFDLKGRRAFPLLRIRNFVTEGPVRSAFGSRRMAAVRDVRTRNSSLTGNLVFLFSESRHQHICGRLERCYPFGRLVRLYWCPSLGIADGVARVPIFHADWTYRFLHPHRVRVPQPSFILHIREEYTLSFAIMPGLFCFAVPLWS